MLSLRACREKDQFNLGRHQVSSANYRLLREYSFKEPGFTAFQYPVIPGDARPFLCVAGVRG